MTRTRDLFKKAVFSVMFSSLLGLVACGGGGYGGGSTSVAGPASKLFAADSPHMAIGSLADPNPAAGTFAVDRIIMGPFYTGLSNNIGSLALDTTLDYLYVGNGTSIRVFYSASMASGDATPARVITGIGNTGSLFLDTVNDRLYVGDDINGVEVFNGASAANGSPAPARIVTGDFGATFQIHGVAVDTSKNMLYVANTNHTTSSDQISVFDAAAAVNGSNPPDRTITPNPVSNVGGIFLDAASDRLYVSSGSGGNLVMVFDAASTADGSTAPARTMTFPSAITSVVVDTVNDRLYAVSLGAIYILSSASTASGVVSATAILAPAGGSFTAVAVNPS